MSKLFAHSLSRPRASCARPLVSISETTTSSMTDMPKLVLRSTLLRFHSLLSAPMLVAAPPGEAPSPPLSRRHDRGRKEHCRQLAPENRLVKQHASSSTSTSTLRTTTPSTCYSSRSTTSDRPPDKHGKFPAVVVSNSRFCAGGARGRRPPFRCRRHLSNTPEGEGGV